VSSRVQLVRPNAAHARRRFSIGNDGALRNLEISDQSLQLSRMAGRRLPAGFPQWLATFPFLMKDVVLFAASVYLLKRDVVRVSLSAKH
jgi:hypothetical protein